MQITDNPIRVLTENAGIFFRDIYGFFNESLETYTFPYILKNTNITPVFKKEFRSSGENYCPVSILPVIKKISEKNFFTNNSFHGFNNVQIPMWVYKKF